MSEGSETEASRSAVLASRDRSDVHPSAVLAHDVALEPGVRIGAFVCIGVDGSGGGVKLRTGSVIRSHTTIYRGVTFGRGVHVGHHVLIRDNTTIGSNVSVGSGCMIEHHVKIADDVRLHSGCFLPEHSVLQKGAWLGPRVTVTNARYPNRSNTKTSLEGVVVEEGAVVGAAVVLLPGIVVGRGALVGAGAVVVRDVPAHATVVGNPSRVLP